MKKRTASPSKTPAQSRQRPPTRFEAIASGVEQSFLHNDSRVITRNREVAQFELAAVEEHILGLKTSLAEVQAKKERLEAKINGLTRVLSRR